MDGVMTKTMISNMTNTQYMQLIAEAPAMLDALRLVSDFLAVKLDEGQASIIEDEVNAVIARIEGDVAPEV
jgi:hypothetical protein